MCCAFLRVFFKSIPKRPSDLVAGQEPLPCGKGVDGFFQKYILCMLPLYPWLGTYAKLT
jgi:hypothetical protein